MILKRNIHMQIFFFKKTRLLAYRFFEFLFLNERKENALGVQMRDEKGHTETKLLRSSKYKPATHIKVDRSLQSV